MFIQTKCNKNVLFFCSDEGLQKCKYFLYLRNIDLSTLKIFSYENNKKVFFIMIMMLVFQTSSVFAQSAAGANLVAHGVLALMGGSREKKQERIIEKSSTQEKIGGLNSTVLRVKESDIKSKAKKILLHCKIG